jgi:hypothetical protein
VNVIFGEARSALSPPPGEHNADSINDRGFPGVVLPDEDGCLIEINGEISDRSKILDAKPSDAHGFAQSMSVILQ